MTSFVRGLRAPLTAAELSRHGDLVKFPPQPFRVLELLVRRGGEVVTRDQIREQIWSGDSFVDFEQGLNFCIRQIREALGDDAERLSTLRRSLGGLPLPFSGRIRRQGDGRVALPHDRSAVPHISARPATDFLAFSLPDALTQFAFRAEDLVGPLQPVPRASAGTRGPREIGAEAEVDVIVAGTLLHAGDGIGSAAS